MSYENYFLAEVRETEESRERDQNLKPTMEVWPVEDEFSCWIAYHEAKDRAVICSTAELKDMPYCGTGYHQPSHSG